MRSCAITDTYSPAPTILLAAPVLAELVPEAPVQAAPALAAPIPWRQHCRLRPAVGRHRQLCPAARAGQSSEGCQEHHQAIERRRHHSAIVSGGAAKAPPRRSLHQRQRSRASSQRARAAAGMLLLGRPSGVTGTVNRWMAALSASSAPAIATPAPAGPRQTACARLTP